MRLLAGVSMIVMHASFGPDGGPYANYTPSERVFPLTVHTLAYLARTELFVIISLFLLTMSLDRRPRGYVETIATQAKRLLIPFVFWAFFYIAWNIFKGYQMGYGHWLVRDLGLLEPWLSWMLLGDMKATMHFLPTLFAVVLFYPLFRYAVRYPILGLLIIVTMMARFEVNSWIFGNISDPVHKQWLLRGTRILSYVGYGMVAASFYGVMISPNFTKWRKAILLSFGVIAIWFASVKFGQLQMRIEHGDMQPNYPKAFWANLMVPVLLFGGAMLLRIRWPDWVSKYAPMSFGIFLIHPFFLDIHRLTIHTTFTDPAVYMLIKIAFAVPMSFLATAMLARIPLLAWTVGQGPLPKLFPRRQPTAA